MMKCSRQSPCNLPQPAWNSVDGTLYDFIYIADFSLKLGFLIVSFTNLQFVNKKIKGAVDDFYLFV